MYHQIQKMIGFMIVLVNGSAKDDYFQQAFNEPMVDIPLAPETGWRFSHSTGICPMYTCSKNDVISSVRKRYCGLELGLGRFRSSFICQGTSTRRERGDLFSHRVKLPPVTTSLTTQR